MTERDIRGLFAALPPIPDDADGAIAPALKIAEEVVVILDRIAIALEAIALNTMPRIKS